MASYRHEATRLEYRPSMQPRLESPDGLPMTTDKKVVPVPCDDAGSSPSTRTTQDKRAQCVSPRCPRTAINSQRSPPAATYEHDACAGFEATGNAREHARNAWVAGWWRDRKSTRLNSSHVAISY